MGSLLAVVVVAVVVARPWQDVPPPLRSSSPPQSLRSVSVDFGIVTDPATDWAALDGHLDEVGATGVELNAGRVEFTAFDWDAYPDAAAEPGSDHLARAARALRLTADGEQRQIGLIVDAFVPVWITQDPSIAGVAPDGTSATSTASATQLARGAVGDRLVQYVAALGARYEPSQIAITELFLDRYSFGDDDLELFREMTGAIDWPRTADGLPDDSDAAVGAWRTEVLAGLLTRMRSALDAVDGGRGAQIELAMEVQVDWDDPGRGSPGVGQDYDVLLRAADRLVVWAYLFGVLPATDVGRLTAALAGEGYDMSRFTISVGMWAPGSVDPPDAISPELMAEAVEQAATNGVTDVNVTPTSLLTDEDWAALAAVWNPTPG
ncbi:hypothetical protein H9657_11665 [Cellulomonas sp. Sa3CUA2]|uniref:Uncharacterized protein n=1 Tax=Cellulomonas avistercoris TaxID=2762242 RepID=A0ABR8QEU0_9CELL|nr:hypothetical protein [Cellulomonas avistercoris]